LEADEKLTEREIADALGIEAPTGGAIPSRNAESVPAPDIRQTISGSWMYVWEMSNGERIGAKIEWPTIEGKELWTVLSIFYAQDSKQKNPTPVLTRTRWNLRSTSHTDSQIRVLNRRGSFQWDARLEQIKAHIESTFQVGDDLVWLGDGEEPQPITYLLHPFLEQNEHTVLAAYGGSTKSLFGLASAISIADGVTILPGTDVGKKAKTLYIDYEANKQTHERRYRSLIAGNEVTDITQNIAYLKLHSVIMDAADAVISMIRKHNFEFVVIDSASRAVGGETVDEGSVISYFNMCAAFKTTVLTIAHKPKDERSRGPSGNSHWYHQARSYWEVLKDQTHGKDEVSIAFKHEKSNNGMLHRAVGYNVSFSDDVINYKSQDAAQSVVIADRLPPIDRIVAFLRENPNSPAKDIAEGTSMRHPQANQLLKQGEGTMFYGSPERRDRRWSMLETQAADRNDESEDDQWWNRD
jgi:hypothetical protein